MTFSKTKQQFKIGRMTYSLPDCLYLPNDEVRFLTFIYLPAMRLWSAHYGIERDVRFECSETTFNKALKALHAKVKEHEHNH